MSRYQTELKNGRILAWGYAFQEQEYFLQEFYTMDESMKIDDANDEAERLTDLGTPPEGFIWKDPEVLFHIANYNSTVEHPDFPGKWTWSNNEILKLMEGYIDKQSHPLYKEHMAAIALDLTF